MLGSRRQNEQQRPGGEHDERGDAAGQHPEPGTAPGSHWVGVPPGSNSRLIVATSSCVENGFVMYRSAPSDNPLLTSASLPLADSITILIWASSGRSRILWQTSKPLLMGIMTSISTTSGRWLSTCSSASAPLV